MTGQEAAALYAATFTPEFEELLRSLPEASEAFAAMLVAKDPMLDRVEVCDGKVGETSGFLGICAICATPGPFAPIVPAPQPGCATAASRAVLPSQASMYGSPAALLRGEPPTV